MLTRVNLANLRCSTTASSGTLLPSESTTSNASVDTSSPSSARRSRYFSNAPEGGTSPSRICASFAAEYSAVRSGDTYYPLHALLLSRPHAL
jgi:hypothetical protein